MVEEKRNAMIPRPSGAIEKIGPGPRDILTRMVSDALVLARSQEKSLTAARFRIGNYELRGADYRQILLWAKALELEPAGIIQRLESSSCEDRDRATLKFRVENGSIVTLAWDFDLLPLPVFEWVDGLVIREVGFKGLLTAPPHISLRLPLLVRLNCSGINLTEIDLSHVPRLTELSCHSNPLTELDLSNVPGLTELWCHSKLFRKFFIEGGMLAWPNGVDIAPEALYAARDSTKKTRDRALEGTRIKPRAPQRGR
jgi:hypothetical protein